MDMVVITLLSDFGGTEYSALMKGVILSINPEVQIIDITHNITPQNIMEGSFVLKNSVHYFPEGSIHTSVVDPGVGSSRKAIAVECHRGILIGPDNGLLVPAAKVLGLKNIYEISNTKFLAEKISDTFHGRDIFAPVAAALAKDMTQLSELGPLMNESPVELEVEQPKVFEGQLRGQIMHIDHFGNLITDVPASMVEKVLPVSDSYHPLELYLNESYVQIEFLKNYSQAKEGRIIAVISSSGHLEFAVASGSASLRMTARVGDKFKINL
jgi:S-adenosylmethionine hydrolase